MLIRKKILIFLAVQAAGVLIAVIALPYYLFYLQDKQNQHVSEMLGIQLEINAALREQVGLLGERIRINGESDRAQSLRLGRVMDLTIKNTTDLTEVIIEQGKMGTFATELLVEQTSIIRSQSSIMEIQIEQGNTLAALLSSDVVQTN